MTSLYYYIFLSLLHIYLIYKKQKYGRESLSTITTTTTTINKKQLVIEQMLKWNDYDAVMQTLLYGWVITIFGELFQFRVVEFILNIPVLFTSLIYIASYIGYNLTTVYKKRKTNTTTHKK